MDIWGQEMIANNMHKCGMWKLDTDIQTLSCGVPPMEGQQKKHNIHSDIKMLLRKDYEVEKILVSYGDKDISGNIIIMNNWKNQHNLVTNDFDAG